MKISIMLLYGSEGGERGEEAGMLLDGGRVKF